MDRKEAIQTLEDLVTAVMAGGGFKSFAALDKCREALKIVRSMEQVIQENNDNDQPHKKDS